MCPHSHSTPSSRALLAVLLAPGGKMRFPPVSRKADTLSFCSTLRLGVVLSMHAAGKQTHPAEVQGSGDAMGMNAYPCARSSWVHRDLARALVLQDGPTPGFSVKESAHGIRSEGSVVDAVGWERGWLGAGSEGVGAHKCATCWGQCSDLRPSLQLVTAAVCTLLA